MLLEILYSTICIENLQPNYAIVPGVLAGIITGASMLGSAGISFFGSQSAGNTQQQIADQQAQLQQQALNQQQQQIQIQQQQNEVMKNVAIYSGIGILFIVVLVIIYKSV